MKPELPKVARDALARQSAGEAHPSADVLTAFLEQSLSGNELERLIGHLAHCADCRQVVFLASDADLAEQPVQEKQKELVAAAMRRFTPALTRVEAPQHLASAPPAEVSPPRRRFRWSWTVAAMAVVLIASGVLVKRHWVLTSSAPKPVTIASNTSAPPQMATQPSPATPSTALSSKQSAAPETAFKTAQANPAQAKPEQAKPEQAKPVPSSAEQELKVDAMARAEQHARAGIATAMIPPPSATGAAGTTEEAGKATAPAVAGGAIKRAPSAMLATNAASAPMVEQQQRQAAPAQPAASLPGGMMNKKAAISPARVVPSQWRITPEGHLERAIVPDTWTRVLPDDAISFHAVAVVGGDVWAGGSGGALFHSSDGGKTWHKILLVAPPVVETGTIVSLEFRDSMHGVATTEGGARWSTSDAGVIWAKQ
jgi:Putative zinc-finger